MLLILLFVFLLLIGAPIAIAIGLTSIVAIIDSGISLDVAARTIFSGVDSFTLMAIPFFIFAGDLMLVGGISKRLIDMAKKWVGWTTGGLPIAGVIASMFFAAVSGSSPATVAAIGGIMIPSLKEAKYNPNFSVGLMCAAGSLGIIIPPSITLLVYGVIAEQSISKLFMAGVLPGVIIGLALIIFSYIMAKRDGHKPSERYSIGEVFRSTFKAFWAILMPVIVLGGIYFGVFTPTEAAAVAIVYSMFISMFVYRELTMKKLIECAKKSVVISAMIMYVIANAKIFSWYLTYKRIPIELSNFVLEYATTPLLIILAITVILLIVGMFMDASAAVLILVPLFLPIVMEIGFDPIHFGVLMIVNLAIGMLTPPFGLNLFVAMGISGMTLTQVTKACIPFIILLIALLLVFTFIPQISLFLPSLIF